jgi:hypothetical protein
MPGPGTRRAGRWLALAAAGAVAGAVGLAIELCGGSPPAPGVEPPGRSASSSGSGPAPGAAPGPAPAPPPDPAAGSQELVRAARAEAAAGNLVQARALLARACDLAPSPATLLELAAIEFQTGGCRTAQRRAQQVIAAAPGEPLAGQARDLLGKIGRCD